MAAESKIDKLVVSSINAPAAIGPYSQAIMSKCLLFCSGQIALDPKSMEKVLIGDDVSTQAGQALKNLQHVLEEAGLALSDVVKTTVLLQTMDDYAAVNAVYSDYFSTCPPARAAFSVKGLPAGALVEIEATALVRDTEKSVVASSNAPAAIGPYSQAIASGGLLFCSGQIALDPTCTEKVLVGGDDVALQADQALRNLAAVLAEAGSSMDQVVKTTVLLSSMDDYAAVNAVYARHFTDLPPARAAFSVKGLPAGALVEIEATALG
jgi:2-iminobutanoate/2-iminopropanoate deaminase